MKLKDEKGWNETVEANQDPYGKAGVDFARDWAEFMEARIEKGETLEDVAKDTSFDASKIHGITGFMYGAAVSILSQVWEHGEELRKWHNLDMQFGNEGERANESGGVLNPALLTIET